MLSSIFRVGAQISRTIVRRSLLGDKVVLATLKRNVGANAAFSSGCVVKVTHHVHALTQAERIGIVKEGDLVLLGVALSSCNEAWVLLVRP